MFFVEIIEGREHKGFVCLSLKSLKSKLTNLFNEWSDGETWPNGDPMGWSSLIDSVNQEKDYYKIVGMVYDFGLAAGTRTIICFYKLTDGEMFELIE